MPDFLEEKRKEISQRMKVLLDEYNRLEAADRSAGRSQPQLEVKLHDAAASGGRPKGSGSGKRGRPRGSGRANQALELVKARPGITIPELAEAMGIKQNYLYRVLPGLADEGKVTKSGRGWHGEDAA